MPCAWIQAVFKKWRPLIAARFAPKLELLCCPALTVGIAFGNFTSTMAPMKRRISILFVLALLLVAKIDLPAQLKEKATFFGGFTYHLVNLTPVGSTNSLRYFFYGLTGGMDYVLLHSNDVASIGVNPNLHVGFTYDARTGANLLAQAPVYMLARVGANATPFNEQKFGIGAGIGLNYSYLTQKSYVQDLGGNVFLLKINQGFLNPMALVELSIKTRSWSNIIRFHWSLYKPTHEVRVGIDKYQFRYGAGGLGILYNF